MAEMRQEEEEQTSLQPSILPTLHLRITKNLAIDAPLSTIQSPLNRYPELATYVNPFSGITALHQACQYSTREDVIRFILAKNEAALRVVDRRGESIPLLLALGNENFPVAVLETMVELYPESLCFAHSDSMSGLHLALAVRRISRRRDNTRLVSSLVRIARQACPQVFARQDSSGRTPVMIGIMCQASADSIKAVARAIPSALSIQESRGITPLHLVASSSSLVVVDPEWRYQIIKCLIEEWPLACLCLDQGKAAVTESDDDDEKEEIPKRIPIQVAIAALHASADPAVSSFVIDANNLLLETTKVFLSLLMQVSMNRHVRASSWPACKHVVAVVASSSVHHHQNDGLPPKLCPLSQVDQVRNLLDHDGVQSLIRQEAYSHLMCGLRAMNDDYIREDASGGNKVRGGVRVQLLESVTNGSMAANVDCWFLHLRENPSLWCSSSSS